MKYAMNLNGKVNLIVADASFAAENPAVFEVPDEVQQGWEITLDGNVIKPIVYENVVDEDGNIVDKIKISDAIIIELD